MVSNTTKRSYRGLRSAFEDRDLAAIPTFAFSGGFGLLAGQQLTDFVLPKVGFSKNPSTAKGHAASALIKVAASFLVVTMLGSMGDAGLVIGGGLASGMLALAGADVLSVLGVGNMLSAPASMASSSTSGRSVRSSRSRRSVSRSRSPSRSTSSTTSSRSVSSRGSSSADKVSAW